MHHQGSTGGTEGAGRFGLDGVFAVGVIRTAVEDAEASFALSHLALFTGGASDIGRGQGIVIFFDEFAFGEIGTGDECAEFSFARDEFAILAFRTGFASFFGRFHDFAFGSERAIAVGKT